MESICRRRCRRARQGPVDGRRARPDRDALADGTAIWDAEWEQYHSGYSTGDAAVSFATVETPVSAAIPIGECMGDAPRAHFDLEIEGHSVPVVASELRLLSDLVRGRPDRWLPIAAHLALHGYDEDLLSRCLRSVPHALRERVQALIAAHD